MIDVSDNARIISFIYVDKLSSVCLLLKKDVSRRFVPEVGAAVVLNALLGHLRELEVS